MRAGLVLFLLVADATVAFAQADLVLLRGRVVAAHNDVPLRRARVGPARRDPRVEQVLTDAEGRFVFAVPRQLPLALVVSKGGYVSETVQVPPIGDSPPAELQIRLSRGGAISGRVLESSGATPLPNSVVARRIDAGPRGAAPETFQAQTDGQGEYRIFGLPAGRYSVSAGLSAIIGTAQDTVAVQPAGSSRTIEIRGGDEHSGVDFDVETSPVARAAAGERLRAILDPASLKSTGVTGTIVDDFGEPFQGADVQVLTVQYRSGRMAALRTASAIVAILGRPSDDRGRYRLDGLPPGSYLVVASTGSARFVPDPERTVNVLPVYYPGTPSIDGALPVQLDGGRDTIGVDLTLTMSAGARVSGVAVDESGTGLSGSVRIVASHRSNAIALDPREMQLSWPSGRFELANVPPGEYVVHVVGEPGFASPPRFGAAYVSVPEGGDPPPMTITATPGATLEGRITIEGAQSRIAEVYVKPLPADLDLGPADLGPFRGSGFVASSDGTFSVRRLHGPTRFALSSAPEGWYLKSFAIGGVDVTDAPFDFGSSGATFEGAEIVVSPAGASVTGTVSGADVASVAASSLVIFPADSSAWFDGSRHVKYARALANGSFRIRGLPPGTYLIAAVDAADGALAAGGWQNPDVLASLAPLATRLTLAEGQTATTTLRATRRPR